ncbi:FAD-binding protein [Bulleidia sp. zg-1006]|uniref:FAD-binding protein n=1 Tax=Bulleidia sp. zg-1006 TaxID=2806552 RepID=UPI00193AAF37|nr:FAD-binding protein [Bulleidia sp. zg-1006]QRG87090.1 FAD-binding protein [Bulleidia sp. zg-1006]
MKKVVNGLLAVGIAVSLVACSSYSKYKPGTYSATSKGHSSEVKVTAEFSKNKIEKVTVDASGETASIGQAAVEQLVKNILSKQSGEFDGVTGATETSDAVRRALKASINQASVKDGVYKAIANSFSVTGQMKGEVTIANGRIKDVKISEESDSTTGQWFEQAKTKFIPRLLENQSLATDSVTGATTSSGAIRSIVSSAIEQAGGKSDEWYTPVEKKKDTVKLEGYDVVVVGLGGSGILSYASAADNGAKVFGFDAAAQIGGNSASVYGPMALNSKNLAKKYNGGKDYISTDEVYQTWLKYVGTDKKADVIKEAVEQSGTALDYYMDKYDFSFDGMGGLVGSFVVPTWTKLWTVYTADKANKKWYTFGPDHTFQFTHALEKAKAKNEKNDYKLELSAKELLKDNKGNVTGVKAVSYDGTTYEIYGKSVILATGGFLGNEEMLKETYGSSIRPIGDTVNKGSGIKMGQSVGGATYAMKTLPMVHVSQVPNIIRDNSLTADQKAILSAIATTLDGKQIDETGKVLGKADKSGTENSELTVGIVYTPGFHFYNVYSQEEIDAIKTKGLSEKTAKVSIFGLGQGGKVPMANTPIKDIDKIIEVAMNTNNAWKGTASELAKKLNMKEEELVKSLGDKDKNYYLFESVAYSYGTVGGLDVNKNMNVLRKDGSPIVNLFAVGQDSEGVANKDGEAYTPWGGQAQSWTFVSGKIAGEQAAKLAK